MDGITGLRRTRALVVGSALAAAFAFGAQISLAQSKPDFAGNWNFNKDQSDDASQKIHEAEAQARSQRGGYPGGRYPGGGVPGGGYPGGGYPGGGYPGGGGIGFPGGRVGMGGMGPGMGRGRPRGGAPEAGMSSADTEQMAETPKTLQIDQEEKKITITDDNGGVTNLYPDGKKHKEKDSTGQSNTIKTHWDGDRLVSESKLHSGKLTQTYALSPDGKQLDVLSTLDAGRNGSLAIRRVYDSAKGSSK
ncbi:MAG TPA: hypothetical protein VGZ29_10755 [Terriglobia bacterium]|nr:hypothetical protein [Terriglobia bacterium]